MFELCFGKYFYSKKDNAKFILSCLLLYLAEFCVVFIKINMLNLPLKNNQFYSQKSKQLYFNIEQSLAIKIFKRTINKSSTANLYNYKNFSR